MRLLFVDIIIFIGGLIAGGAITALAAASGRDSMCDTCLYKAFHQRGNIDKENDKC